MRNILVLVFSFMILTSLSYSEEKAPRERTENRNSSSDRRPTQAKRVDNYLAVFDLEVISPVDKKITRPLSDSVKREVVKSGKYEVMERGQMDKILKEQAFQMTGCVAKECAVEAGQMLGVGRVIVGSVSQVGKTYLLSLSLVNVETGKAEAVEDQECKCEIDDLIQLSKSVANKLLGEDIGSESSMTRLSKNEDLTTKDFDAKNEWLNNANLPNKSMTFQDANKFIASLNGRNYLGYNNWRLPTEDEILYFIKLADRNGYNNDYIGWLKHLKIEHTQTEFYWTTTPSGLGSNYTKAVRLIDGKTTNHIKDIPLSIWPVRSFN